MLRNVNEKSIAIIDELGRGTSTRDGLSIAVAMAEELIRSRALVWFVTHYDELAEVLGNRFGVMNLHLATETVTLANNFPKMTMLYTLNSGRVREEHYGITLAKATGFPDSFIEKAETVAKSLRQQRLAKKQSPEARKLISRQNLIMNLHEQLKQAYSSKLDGRALASHLQRLQGEFIARLEAIEDGDGTSSVQEIASLSGSTVPDSAALDKSSVMEIDDVRIEAVEGGSGRCPVEEPTSCSGSDIPGSLILNGYRYLDVDDEFDDGGIDDESLLKKGGL